MTAVSINRADLDLFRQGSNAAAVCLATLAGIGGGWLANDVGTGAIRRTDMRVFAEGTHLGSIQAPDRVEPFVQPTRVERLIALTGLSQRQLSSVLGVSHTMVGQWAHSEPARPELTELLAAVDKANRYHPELKQWLLQPTRGTNVTPLELLAARNWRAFEGAIRSTPAAAPRLSPAEMAESRLAEVSWAVAEPPIPVVDE